MDGSSITTLLLFSDTLMLRIHSHDCQAVKNQTEANLAHSRGGASALVRKE